MLVKQSKRMKEIYASSSSYLFFLFVNIHHSTKDDESPSAGKKHIIAPTVRIQIVEVGLAVCNVSANDCVHRRQPF